MQTVRVYTSRPLVPEGTGNAEIAEFEELGRGHEDVLGLEVAVEDLVLVEVGEGEHDLHEEVADRLLVEQALGLSLPLDEVLKKETFNWLDK